MTSDRYARFESIDWWDQDLLGSSRALVAGVGALGTEVVKNLLLLGWGTVVLVDFDLVEEGNLAKSLFFSASDIGRPKVEVVRTAASRYNPDCTVVALNGELRAMAGAGLLARMDVAFGCLDNAAARVALGQLTGLSGCLFIDGGLTTWEGTIRLFSPEADTPCYACTLTSEDLRDLTLRHSCLAYAERAQFGQGTPTTPIGASAIGALMVQQAVKWIHREHHTLQLPLGEELRLDLAHDRFFRTALPRSEECLLHPERRTPVDGGGGRTEVAAGRSWAELLTSWRADVCAPDAVLHLPLEVKADDTCQSCGMSFPVNRVHSGGEATPCSSCDGGTVPELCNVVTGEETWSYLSPSETGFPPWSWVEARSSTTDAPILLELPGPPAQTDLARLDRRR